MKVLVTGFPPFAGVVANPSQTLVDALRIELLNVAGVEIIAETVPVEYRGVEIVFDQLLKDYQPDLVLSFGVGRHAHTFRFESLAVNLDDAGIPDNAGEYRSQVPIIVKGPRQIESPLDLEMITATLASHGIPAEISQNAGRYVCNHLLYYGSYQQSQVVRPYLFLFTHLPTIENGFELERTLKGLELMIECLAIR